MLELIFLLLNGGRMSQPVEDDTYTSAVLAVSYVAASEHGDATLVFEPHRNYTFIGSVNDACSYGVTWARKTKTVTPFEVLCS